jgi:uncharacterized protein GlcG (DUF336 family)
MKGVRFCLFLVGTLASLPAWGNTQLTEDDVKQIIAQAATRATQVDTQSIIAVVDRAGYVLGVWDVEGKKSPDPFDVSGAIARAGTAAFLSSDQNAFTSRTAGYIIQQHFPPFVRDTTPGPLVGVGISSAGITPDEFVITSTNPTTKVVSINVEQGHSDVNFIKQIPPSMTGTFDPNSPIFYPINPFAPPGTPHPMPPEYPGAQSPGVYGAGTYAGTALSFTVPTGAAASADVTSGTAPSGFIVPGTVPIGASLNDSPGGVPLYKNGELVGGVGVTGDNSPDNVATGVAIVLGSLHKITNQKDATPGFKEGPDTDEDVALAGQSGFEPDKSILATLDYIGGIQIPYVQTNTSLSGVMPLSSLGVAVTGYPLQKSPPAFDYPPAEFGGVAGAIRFPIRGDTMTGKIGKTSRLTAGEVGDIIGNVAARSAITRAGIRLPVGVPAEVFISVVGDPEDTGKPPPILGVFGTHDATVFSWDVAVQKARTAFFFSNNDLAESSRTVGFLAQRYYPPGLDGNPPGPFFGLQEGLLVDQFLFFAMHVGKANPYLPNQITVFPGGFPLYRGGVLIGAVGVSGDGVDQDDIISASGTVNFEPPHNITADNFLYQGARLPYAKFPRDPAP